MPHQAGERSAERFEHSEFQIEIIFALQAGSIQYRRVCDGLDDMGEIADRSLVSANMRYKFLVLIRLDTEPDSLRAFRPRRRKFGFYAGSAVNT